MLSATFPLGMVQAVMFKPGRTQNQRNELCRVNAEIKSNWDSGLLSETFSLQSKMGGRSCLQSKTGGSNEYVDCTDAKQEWRWRTDGKLQSGIKEAHDLDTYFYTHTKLRACKETYLPKNEDIRKKVTAAYCPCGQDFVGSTCHDIDECKEAFTCPEHSECHNLPGNGYECQCEAGFENFLTGGPDVEKHTGKCVTAPKQVVSQVGVSSFEVSISNVTPGRVKLVLHQLADDAGGLAVPLPD